MSEDYSSQQRELTTLRAPGLGQHGRFMAAFSLRIVESKAGMSFAIAVSEVASERLHKDHNSTAPEEGYHT
jgi:hypothetical protein